LAIAVVATLAAVAAQPAHARLVYQRADAREVVVASDDGSGARVIARGFAPALSPDGRRVAFFRDGRGIAERLFVVSATGGRSRLVARSVAAARSPAATQSVSWSPDGRRIALSRARGADGVIVDLARGRVTRVRGNLAYGGATFSPDGSRAVVVGVDIRRVTLDLLSLRRERVRAIGSGGCPAWGPAGIAYRGDRGIVVKRRPRSDGRVIMTVDEERRMCPLAWSRDGGTLLLGAESAYPAFNALLVAPDGADPQTLDVPFSKVAGVSHSGDQVLGLVGDDVVIATRDGGSQVAVRDAAYPSWDR
jgi:hypothetical protein